MRLVQDNSARKEGGAREATQARQLVGRLLRAFLLTAALILVVMAAVLSVLGVREGLDAMRAALTSAKPYLVLLHFTLIALLWWQWARLIGWADRIAPVPDSFREAMLALRHRAALTLLAIELIVVVGLPAATGGPVP